MRGSDRGRQGARQEGSQTVESGSQVLLLIGEGAARVGRDCVLAALPTGVLTEMVVRASALLSFASLGAVIIVPLLHTQMK